jgi:6-pyruvoyltetrahydropterin/6-carboxytetrahydropterin synthase
MTRITREIGIDMGHRVTNHGSKCRNLHGHRYRIIATLAGDLVASGEQEGMVLDYGFVKKIMMDEIDARFDHGMALWIKDPLLIHELGPVRERIEDDVHLEGYAFGETGWKWGKLVVTRDVPTAENLARLWYGIISEPIAQMCDGTDGHLYSVTVWETPNCSAIYRPNVSQAKIRKID